MNASVSENIPLSDGSTVLVEVASDSSTYRYLIETQGALGESGSLSVAKDIANLFLATERCNQEMEVTTSFDFNCIILADLSANHLST